MIHEIPIWTRRGDRMQKANTLDIINWQWRCVRKPSTSAWMGWLPGIGIVVRFLCREADPKRTVTAPPAYVHCDSAVEAFLTITPGNAPHAASPYINFEVNPNGVLYACTGAGRDGRAVISAAEYRLADVRTAVGTDAWQAQWVIPLAVLRRAFGISELSAGDSIWFNLYKISQDPAIEHYGSLAPVQSATPDFHRPDCFVEGVLAHA